MKAFAIFVCASGLLLTGCEPQAKEDEFPIPRYKFETQVLQKTPLNNEISICYKFDPVTGKAWIARSMIGETPIWHEITNAWISPEARENTNNPPLQTASPDYQNR